MHDGSPAGLQWSQWSRSVCSTWLCVKIGSSPNHWFTSVSQFWAHKLAGARYQRCPAMVEPGIPSASEIWEALCMATAWTTKFMCLVLRMFQSANHTSWKAARRLMLNPVAPRRCQRWIAPEVAAIGATTHDDHPKQDRSMSQMRWLP